MINLNVDMLVHTWESFQNTKFGVALDGYVSGGPRWNPDGPCVNFNHHEQVDRLSTRATCAQVLIALRQGLLDAFKDNGKTRLEVFVNDCDQDVCLSWFILNNHWIAENAINARLNRLAHLEDMMDTCAGSYPFPIELPALEEMEWVFEPYNRFRLNGGLDKKIPGDYKSIICDVEHRISQHVAGAGKRIELDTRYDILHQNGGLVVVNEKGPAARLALLSSGIKMFISVRERGDNTWQYSIGKLSKYIPANMLELVKLLNAAEGIDDNAKDRWGGAETIMGSPRTGGSKLNPEQVRKIMEEYVFNAKKTYVQGVVG